jgi:hypothetical protein
MTTNSNQTFHLIEQFSEQAPFAVWILDAHGLAVFANPKLQETLHSIHFMPEPLGLNLFHGPTAGELGLDDVCQRLLNGETIEETVESGGPQATNVDQVGFFSLHVVAYPLLAADDRVENYVIVINDVTPSRIAQEKLRRKMQDVKILQDAKSSRESRATELLAEINRLEKEIRTYGGKP